MLNIKKKNRQVSSKKILTKMSVSNVHIKYCASQAVFNAVALTNLKLHRDYYHADIQIIKNIALISICEEIKFAFEIKKFEVVGDSVVISGSDQSVLIYERRENFKEEFMFGGN